MALSQATITSWLTWLSTHLAATLAVTSAELRDFCGVGAGLADEGGLADDCGLVGAFAADPRAESVIDTRAAAIKITASAATPATRGPRLREVRFCRLRGAWTGTGT
jgi:hypothetical protein